MKFLSLNFLIASLLLIMVSAASSVDKPESRNIIIHKDPIKYNKVTFKDIERNVDVNLNKFEGNLVILNFWATWCAPCKKEMPHLSKLKNNDKLPNIEIFPINISNESKKNQKNFFKNLNIKNLQIFSGSPIELASKFQIIGLPTTIFINKKGDEFARVIGSYDFTDKEFIEWLRKYN